MNIAIVLGSARQGRQSHKVAYYLKKLLEERGLKTDLIDPVVDPLPLFDGKSERPTTIDIEIKKISDRLMDADAFIMVSPEYHGSFSGLFKNYLDYFWIEFQKKPIGVATVSAGEMGGINASSHLQHVILSLGAYPVPMKLLVPEVNTTFNEAYEPIRDRITNSANRFLDEFLWLADALTNQKMKEHGKLWNRETNGSSAETQVPIGAVVKMANDVFSNIIRSTADGGSFDRVEWHLLNLVRDKGTLSTSEAIEHLTFFAPHETISRRIKSYAAAGYFTTEGEEISMTEKGHKVFEEVSGVQEEIKKKSMNGISAWEYRTAIRTLQKIIENLETVPRQGNGPIST